jgi:serine/threonine protein phosphatase 1
MIYAIPDIHGQREKLEAALDRIEHDGGPEARIVFLGDYIDRGPDSRGVIDLLLAGQEEGRPWTCIMGNHDRMFLRFVTSGIEHDPAIKSGKSWINPALGGTTTLASYGLVPGTGPCFSRNPRTELETLISFGLPDSQLSARELVNRAREVVPQAHLDFLAALPLWHEQDDLLFVHAGIRPGIPIEDQDEDDLVWIRKGFLEDDRDHGRLVVHGHTAVEAPMHCGNRVNLDGGAGHGRALVPAVFEGRDCWLLTENGRVALT